MSGWKLPEPVGEFLRAAQVGDADRLISTMEPGAVLIDSGREFAGHGVRAWVRQLRGVFPMRLRAVHLQHQGQAVLMTVLLMREGPEDGEPFEWRFEFAAERIARIVIERHRPVALPAPVAAFLRATNAGDLEGVASAFADDAIVNDQLTEHWGEAAIREWAALDVVGTRLQIRQIAALDHYGNTILTAHLRGEFDSRGLPDPLVLVFHFSTRGDRIVQLIMLRNLSGV